MIELAQKNQKRDVKSPRDKQKKKSQKHLGHEDKPTEPFSEMVEQASTARRSNHPHPKPPTTMDNNTDANYWHGKTKS